MADRIRVLIADAAEEVGSLAAALATHSPIDLVGSASTMQEVLAATAALQPHLVVVGTTLPGEGGLPGDAADREAPPGASTTAPGGLAATEAITARFPWVAVIVVATRDGPEELRRAMLAGARHFLVKPVTPAELVASIEEVYQRELTRRRALAAPASLPAPAGPGAPPVPARAPREGQIFTFYSAKGGVGCTTLACNVAIALKRATGKAVALFDCSLLFGDVGVVLNVSPRQTIVDLLPHGNSLDDEILDQVLVAHASGVRVLLSPPSPEKAELVTPELVRGVLAALRARFDYVVIDTWPTFEERVLHVLDASDRIVVPTTLEMPAIKNCKLLLDVAAALAYPPEKIVLVLNRSDSRGGINVHDVEELLHKRFDAEVVSDGRLTTHSLNEGVPFVTSHPEAAISANVMALATQLSGAPAPLAAEPRPRRAAGLLRSLLGAGG